MRYVITGQRNQIGPQIICGLNRALKMSWIYDRAEVKVGKMNYAEPIKTFWQTAQVNLLPFDRQHERLGESHPRHFTEGGLNYRQRPRIWSWPAGRRAVMSPANWSGHILFGGKFLNAAHYSVRWRSAQRAGARPVGGFAATLLPSLLRVPQKP